MKPREFEYLAARLAERGTHPSEFRTAISRAYYAVYNVGVELLREMGVTPIEGPGGHGDVRRYFNYSGNSDVKKVASQMADLAASRVHADYHLDRNDVENKKKAKALVHQATRMIETLTKCCTGQRRDQIIKSIQELDRKVKRAGNDARKENHT